MPVMRALKGAKKNRMTQSSASVTRRSAARRQIDAMPRNDHEAGNKTQGACGQRVAEIDQDKLDELRQVEGEVGFGLRRIAKGKAQAKHEQSGRERAEKQGP